MAWDDDPASMSSLGLLHDSELELDLDTDERPTAIPEIPMNQLVAESMAAAERNERRSERETGRDAEPVEWHNTPSVPMSTDAIRSSVPPSFGRFELENDPTKRHLTSQPTLPEIDLLDEAPTVERGTPARLRSPDAFATQPAPARSTLEYGSPFEASTATRGQNPLSPPPTVKSPYDDSEEGLHSEAAPQRSLGNGAVSSRPPGSSRLRPSGPPAIYPSPAASPPRSGLRLDNPWTDIPPTARPEQDNQRQVMKDRYATGDFSGALEIADSILEVDDGDLEAQRYAASCRDVLTQMLLSRLGTLDQVVSVALSPEQLRWLTLDHRAGFVLSLVDGSLTLEELLDIASMPRLDSLRIFSHLLEQRVIRLSPH